jgi:hypothetical protein
MSSHHFQVLIIIRCLTYFTSTLLGLDSSVPIWSHRRELKNDETKNGLFLSTQGNNPKSTIVLKYTCRRIIVSKSSFSSGASDFTSTLTGLGPSSFTLASVFGAANQSRICSQTPLFVIILICLQGHQYAKMDSNTCYDSKQFSVRYQKQKKRMKSPIDKECNIFVRDDKTIVDIIQPDGPVSLSLASVFGAANQMQICFSRTLLFVIEFNFFGGHQACIDRKCVTNQSIIDC